MQRHVASDFQSASPPNDERDNCGRCENHCGGLSVVFKVVLSFRRAKIVPQRSQIAAELGNKFLNSSFLIPNSSLSYLSVAFDKIFHRRQSLKTHRTASVKFLRADTDFRAEAEFKAVGEARRRVDINGRRINH